MDEHVLTVASKNNRTYEVRGASKVRVKDLKGTEKRLGTLILYFCADGPQTVGPQIIFPLMPKTDLAGNVNPTIPASSVIREEMIHYDSLVTILFQPQGWADGVTSEASLRIAMRSIQTGSLLVLDNLNGHRTEEYKKVAEEKSTFLLYTPAECTDLCAVNDYGLGKWFRDKVKARYMAEYKRQDEIWDLKAPSARERRIKLVNWVADSWKEIRRNQRVIRTAFQRCGVLNQIDGSEDDLIRVKGVDDYWIDNDYDGESLPVDLYADDETYNHFFHED